MTMLAITSLIGIAVGCHQKPEVKRVLPLVNSGDFSELKESDLAAIVVCHDTLGRPDHATRRAPSHASRLSAQARSRRRVSRLLASMRVHIGTQGAHS